MELVATKRSYRRCELGFYLSHNLEDALLFLENIVDETLGRQMLKVGGGVRISSIEVAAIGE